MASPSASKITVATEIRSNLEVIARPGLDRRPSRRFSRQPSETPYLDATINAPLFSGLSDADRKTILSQSVEQDFANREIRSGDQLPEFAIISANKIGR